MRALVLFLRRLVAAAALAATASTCAAGGEPSLRDLAFSTNLQTLTQVPLYEPPQLQLHHPDPAMQLYIFLNRVADKAERAERAERGLTTPDNVAIAEATIAQRAAADAARMLRNTIPPLPPLTSDLPALGRTDAVALELDIDPQAWRSAAVAGGGSDSLPARMGGGGTGSGGGAGVVSSAATANNAPLFYEQQPPITDLSRPLQRMGALPLLLSAAALLLLGWIGWRAAG